MPNVYESANESSRIAYKVAFTGIRAYDKVYAIDMEYYPEKQTIDSSVPGGLNIVAKKKDTRSVVAAQLGPNLRKYAAKLTSGSSVTFTEGVNGMFSLTDKNIPTQIEMDLASANIAALQSAGLQKETDAYKMVYDVSPKQGIAILEGYVTKISDGDTFDIIVTNSPDQVIGAPQTGEDRKIQPIQQGDNVRIRLGGINTPETHKTWDADIEADAVKRNTQWIQKHGRSTDYIEQAFTIGAEAKELSTRLLTGKKVVIQVDTLYDTVWDDLMQLLRNTDNRTMGQGIDAFGRIIGEVFILGNYLGGYDSINLNKTLIANTSRTVTDFALAEISYVVDSKTRKPRTALPVLQWYGVTPEAEMLRAEVARDAQPQANPIDEWMRENHMHMATDGEILYNDAKEIKDVTVTLVTVEGDTLYSLSERLGYTVADLRTWSNLAYGDTQPLPAGTIVKYNKTETVSTAWENTMLVPAETEDEVYRGRVDDRNRLDEKYGFYRGRGFTRIGDCCFVVPPTSIYIESASTSEKYFKIRSSGPIQTRGHQMDTVIRMKLFFATVDQVNGVKMAGPTKSYYRNGLLPLLAQFQKAPFLPIENELINDTHHYYSVALMDIRVSSVPGFPDCMEAELTMAPFDHIPYMPKVEYFAGAFCWPLYRWYYQQAIESDIARPDGIVYDGIDETVFNGRRKHGLRPIERLSDEVIFRIADENELAARKQAIMDLRYKLDPEVFKAAVEDEYANENNAARAELKLGLAQYERFRNAIAKYNYRRYPYLYNENNNYGAAVLTTIPHIVASEKVLSFTPGGGAPTMTQDEERLVREELRSLADVLNQTYLDGEMPIFLINGLLNVLFMTGAYTYLPATEYLGMTKEYEIFQRVWNQIVDNRARGYSLMRIEEDGLYGGYLVIQILDKSIYSRFPKSASAGESYYKLDPKDQAHISLFDNIDGSSLGVKKYELEYESMNTLAHMTEADIPMVEYPIDGLITERISVQMRNTMVPIKLLEQQNPSFQYLGKGETLIEIQMRTLSRTAVEKLRAMLAMVNQYQMEYGISITSSILKVDNNILALAGIESALIQAISVETTGDKESFRININMVGFDQTQRSSEELKQSSIFSRDTYVGSSAELYDAFQAYAKRKRNDQGFEYGVIDRDLRNAEVYPDMSLPTYDEVNAIIPALGLKFANGKKFTGLANPDHAKFVDPDFYIRADETFRDCIYDAIHQGQIPILYSDRIGGVAGDATPSDDQAAAGMATSNIVLSPSTQSFINEQIAKLPKSKMKSEMLTSAAGTYSGDNLTSDSKIKYANFQKVYDWGRSYDRNLLASLKPEDLTRKPSQAELAAWGMNSIEVPTFEQISLMIENLANEYLISVPTGIVWMLSNNISGLSDLRNATADSISYTYGKDGTITGPAVTREKAINLYKSIIENESSWNQFMPDGSPNLGLNTNHTTGTLESIDIGIGQVNSKSGDYGSLAEARRCAWDWKFALQLSMGHFCMTWNFLIDELKKENNEDKWAQFLDRLVIAYHQWVKDAVALNVLTSDSYYTKIKSTFMNKYGASPLYKRQVADALPVTGQSLNANAEDLYRQFVQYLWNWQEMKRDTSAKAGALGAIGATVPGFSAATAAISFTSDSWDKGLRDSLPEALRRISYETTAFGQGTFGNDTYLVVDPYIETVKYRTLVQENSSILKVADFSKWVGMAMYPILQKMGLHSVSPETHFVLIKDGAADALCTPILEKGKSVRAIHPTTIGIEQLIPYISVVEIQAESIKKANGSVVVTSVKMGDELTTSMQNAYQMAVFLKIFAKGNAGKSFQAAYKDMLEYDGRGRLLRAFPTYHLYIIDEGRAMQWHKMWDNFYGYNALLSAEVIKDRRIVADTCILRVSNMYHGLSSYDCETSFGKWDRSVVDLIFGGGAEFTKKQKAENRTKVWRTIWDLPDKDQLQARRDELNSMMLKTGARIHFRMGYGSNAAALPIAINGTVTEVELGDVVTMIVQGDGLELTNKLRVPVSKTTTAGWLRGTAEPRQFLCEMMTSKGKMWASIINSLSDGLFYNKSPLGIVHFGSVEMPMSNIINAIPIASLFDKVKGQYMDYGEVGQNIYCGAGKETRSQWLYTSEREFFSDVVAWSQNVPKFSEMDEPTVKLNLFDKTPWDMFQAYRAVCPDYVSAVIPFEFRSSVYFGKPNWMAVTSYKYKYYYEKNKKFVYRVPDEENTRTFSQYRSWTGSFDIISNEITASERYLYNNVMAKYNLEGKPKLTEIYQVDSDIADEKQKTAIVEVPIECDGGLKAATKWVATQGAKQFGNENDGWANQVRYAETAAVSALKDYMREMYQGELIVWGDPSAKPHDTAYMSDGYNQMAGSFWVKRVIHSFNPDTGFRTSVSPDAISIIDDLEGISHVNWGTAASATAIANISGFILTTGLTMLLKEPIGHALSTSGAKAASVLFKEFLSKSANLTHEERIFMLWAGNVVEEQVESLAKRAGVKTAASTALKDWYNLSSSDAAEWFRQKLTNSAEANFIEYCQHKNRIGQMDTIIKGLQQEVDAYEIIIKSMLPEALDYEGTEWGDFVGVDSYKTKKGKLLEEMKTAVRENKIKIEKMARESSAIVKDVEKNVEGAAEAYAALGKNNVLVGLPGDAITSITDSPGHALKTAMTKILHLDNAKSASSKTVKVLTAIKENIMTPGATMKWVDEMWDGKKIVKAIKGAKAVDGVADAVTDAAKVSDAIADAAKVADAAGDVAEAASKGLSMGKVVGKVWKPINGVAKLATKTVAGTGAFAIRNTAKLVMAASKSKWILALTPYVIIDIAISIVGANLVDWISRALDRRQALVVIPLKYRGQNFTAGMNGSRGAIYGTAPSVMDAFLAGEGVGGGFVKTAYAILGVKQPEYSLNADDYEEVEE